MIDTNKALWSNQMDDEKNDLSKLLQAVTHLYNENEAFKKSEFKLLYDLFT